MNKTEPYDYVIIILGPIIGFMLATLCIRYTFYYCHGGTCIENDEPEIDVPEIDVDDYNDYNEAENDEDRFDGFDNISI
jgi:hypothetical protein